jgi:antitoxin component YwqK of YwqJK toxin-antitoxin module
MSNRFTLYDWIPISERSCDTVKITIFVCLSLLSLYFFAENDTFRRDGITYHESETVRRDGITYHQLSNQPLTGTVMSFPNNGRLLTKTTFIYGKVSLYESFYENGQLLVRQNLIDFLPNETLEIFYDNGQLKSKSNDVDGKKEGLEIGFYRNGNVMYRMNYKNGKKHGLSVTFDLEGNFTSNKTYKNGKLIKKN